MSDEGSSQKSPMDAELPEAQPAQNAYLFKMLSDASFECIFLSEKGVCIGQNQAAEKEFGYTSDEAVGRMGTEWIAPDYRELVMQNMLAGVQEPYTAIALRKDGTTFPCEIQGRMMEYRDRQVRVTALRDITQRLQTESALADSRERHELALTGGRLGTWDLNVETSALQINQRCAEILGFELDELDLVLESWVNLLHPEDAPRILEIFNEHLAGQTEFYETEYRLRRKDGSYVWIQAKGKVIERDSEGTALRAAGTLLDITDRINSQLNYSRIIETATDGFWVVDNRGFVVEMNDAAARMLGYTKDELAGMHLSQIDAHEDDTEVLNRITQIAKRGSMRFETQHRRKDGRRIAVDVNVSYLPIKGGRFVVFVRDISEQQHSKLLIEESEARTRAMFHAVSDAVFLHPLQEEGFANFVDVNQTACERYGYTRQEFLQIDATQISKPQDSKTHSSVSHRRRLRDAGRMTFESTHITKSGEEFPVEINSAVTDIDGQPMILAVVRDISVRKRAQQEKVKLEEQLRQIQKIEALGVLAGGIAHDFNNILFAILGYAEFARDLLPMDHRVRELLKEIITSGNRASDLVKQILTYARRTDRRRQQVDIVPLIKEVHKLIRSTLPANIEIDLKIAVANAVVIADPTEIHQVLMNLCTNAKQAISKSDGRIKVLLEAVEIDASAGVGTTREPLNYYRLVVEDTGSGIPQDILEQIFDPFFTTKEVGKGTGMGLAVVQSVAGELRGWVEVDSTPGIGSVFSVYLPSSSAPLAATADDAVSLPGGNERIMVVDDEPAIANLVKYTLGDLGYQVLSFTNSQAALDHFAKQPGECNLVILDLAMPQLTGGDLAERMLRIRPGLPVIIATGYSETFPESQALALGVKRYLDKPIERATLARVVREVLDGASGG